VLKNDSDEEYDSKEEYNGDEVYDGDEDEIALRLIDELHAEVATITAQLEEYKEDQWVVIKFEVTCHYNFNFLPHDVSVEIATN